jgi:hypothetical protein
MLQAFRSPQSDALAFSEWAHVQGMEPIAELLAGNGTVVSLFRSNRTFSEAEIAKSALPVRQLKLPRFNFEVDDIDVLQFIMRGGDPFSIGTETIREFITDVLNQAYPVTVHSKRENQNFVIYPGFPNKNTWQFAPV